MAMGVNGKSREDKPSHTTWSEGDANVNCPPDVITSQNFLLPKL